jgi:hypothetical protein
MRRLGIVLCMVLSVLAAAGPAIAEWRLYYTAWYQATPDGAGWYLLQPRYDAPGWQAVPTTYAMEGECLAGRAAVLAMDQQIFRSPRPQIQYSLRMWVCLEVPAAPTATACEQLGVENDLPTLLCE